MGNSEKSIIPNQKDNSPKETMLRIPVTTITALLLFVLVCFTCKARADSSVLIILSSTFKPYEEAKEQILKIHQDEHASAGPKSITTHQVETVILEKGIPLDLLRDKIGSSPPSLLVAIGNSALDFAVTIKNVSIVYLLVQNVGRFLGQHENMTGVNLDIPPLVQLTIMNRLFPNSPPILIYDASLNKELARNAQIAAKKISIPLITFSATVPRDIPGLLSSELSETSGLFWIVPDPTVVTPDNIEQIINVSLAKKNPVIAFSEKYLDRGATVAIVSPPAAMGAQAADLISRHIKGESISKIKPVNPNHIRVVINSVILNKLKHPSLPQLPSLLNIDGNEVHIETVFEP